MLIITCIISLFLSPYLISLSHSSYYLLASLQLLIANKGAKLKSNDNKSYHFTVTEAINVNSPIE